MYTAKFFIGTGYGLSVKTVKADSYKELMTKAEEAINWALNKATINLEKVVYCYPSGKTYTKAF